MGGQEGLYVRTNYREKMRSFYVNKAILTFGFRSTMVCVGGCTLVLEKKSVQTVEGDPTTTTSQIFRFPIRHYYDIKL